MPDQPSEPPNLPATTAPGTPAGSEATARKSAPAKPPVELLRDIAREHVREALSVAEAESGGGVVQMLSMEVLRRAPLPTPEEMAGYKAVSPDLPDRIARMAESALEARREDQRAFRALEARRPWIALLAVLAVVSAGSFIGSVDAKAGAVVITATVVGLAAAFLGPKWIERKKDPPADGDSEGE